jgi:serpin B
VEAPAVEISAHKAPVEAPAVEEKDLMAAVVEGNNQFAVDLYRRLAAEKKGNAVFSPYSISTALAMTYAGARGGTGAQMAKTLHFTLPRQQLHPTFARLIADLTAETREGYDLSTANRLWGQKGYEFLPPFLAITRDDYGAELVPLDFGPDPEKARQTINRWIEAETRQKIKNLIPSDTLSPGTRLVLTNAIYFKGDWQHAFRKEGTADAPFTIAPGKTLKTPMMVQQNEFPYAEADGAQVLELPYQGDDLSMVVILPRRPTGLKQVERMLTVEKLDQWIKQLNKQLNKTLVLVHLPKFKMESGFDLSKTLSDMGTPLAFNSRRADFSGMTGDPQGLYISAVIHKAMIDVSEKGTEAAAATAVIAMVASVSPTPKPVTFRADHPFLFVLRDKKTGSILFLGRVVNPKGNP